MTPWEHVRKATIRLADRTRLNVSIEDAKEIERDLHEYCRRREDIDHVEYKRLRAKWMRMESRSVDKNDRE
ncbi:MAG: hypothetical protein AAF497_21365 [Planctomycetota bacterium]